MVAPVLIYDRFNSYGLKFSAPVAADMIFISIVIFVLVRFLNNRAKKIWYNPQEGRDQKVDDIFDKIINEYYFAFEELLKRLESEAERCMD